MKKIVFNAAPLAVALLAIAALPTQAQDRNLGRNLAAQCANCHAKKQVDSIKKKSKETLFNLELFLTRKNCRCSKMV